MLRPGGLLYTITDVEEYHGWILWHFRSGSGSGGDAADGGDGGGDDGSGDERTGVEELWERVSEEELEGDECVKVMKEETEEGKKVSRNKGRKFVAVFRRKEDPGWP